MTNTRNRGANENNNNNNANPPPLEQVLIMQAQMLQTMQQTVANMQQTQGHQPAPQPPALRQAWRVLEDQAPQHSLTLSNQWTQTIG
jgi:hypothetical protein